MGRCAISSLNTQSVPATPEPRPRPESAFWSREGAGGRVRWRAYEVWFRVALSRALPSAAVVPNSGVGYWETSAPPDGTGLTVPGSCLDVRVLSPEWQGLRTSFPGGAEGPWRKHRAVDARFL